MLASLVGIEHEASNGAMHATTVIALVMPTRRLAAICCGPPGLSAASSCSSSDLRRSHPIEGALMLSQMLHC